ncbi:MAG: hypothetical protein H6Q74_1992, partial [Firmicutes bacterium]|nr:hypothetical protein [Bacillota bacterium]
DSPTPTTTDSSLYTDPDIQAKIARLEQLGIRPAITVYKDKAD